MVLHILTVALAMFDVGSDALFAWRLFSECLSFLFFSS